MLLDRVEAYILKNALILPGETVIVGFSGGPDSLCLSHMLWRLSPRYGWTVILAHFDHQLRGSASDEDAEFCREWAASKALAFRMHGRDVAREAESSGESTELAARRLRYDFFRDLQRETGAARIALGHHQDDQAETVLMRLIRGTGTDGLAGMRPSRADGVVRPLLAQSRQDILSYCVTHELDPRIDHTNFEGLYTRNCLRLEILPLLADRYNPRIAEALSRTALLAAEDSDCLNAMADSALEKWCPEAMGGVKIPIPELRNLPMAILKRVLRNGVHRVTGSKENLESEHVEQILKLINTPKTGKHVVLCGTRFAISYDELLLSREQARAFEEETEIVLEVGTVKVFGGAITMQPIAPEDWNQNAKLSADTVVIDMDSVRGPLRARSRQPGDAMIPFGMSGFKKLKSLMIDLKIPRERRDTIPVISDSEKVVWVAGVRLDERVRVSDTSKKLMRLSWSVCCSQDINMLE